MSSSGVYLTVVIPAYNEERRLPSTLDSVEKYLESRNISYEVIVVNDGSHDGTAKLVQDVATRNPNFRLLSYEQNQGKGYAVRLGMQNGRGEILLYNDADGSSPISEVSRLEKALSEGADVAVGSRAVASAQTSVSTVWYRKIIGRTFATLVNILIVPGIADTQCGFKLFRRSAADYVFQRQRAERFSFDVELLFLARKAGFQIAEVPINWTNCPGSKVNLVVDSMDMFLDILKIRLRYWLGVYRNPISDPK